MEKYLWWTCKEKLVIGSSEISALWRFLVLFMCFEIKGLSGDTGFSVSDSIQHSWRRWLCSWTSSIPKYYPSLIWRTRDTWVTKSSPLTWKAALWCASSTDPSGTCSLTVPPAFLGSTGCSAWQKRGKLSACFQRAFWGSTAAHWDPDASLLPSPAHLPCQVVQESGAEPWSMVTTHSWRRKRV